MWIQETVEVEQVKMQQHAIEPRFYFLFPQQESYDSLPNVVIILNPNGTVNEELMLAHGMNLETIKAVTEQGINLQVLLSQFYLFYISISGCRDWSTDE